MRDLFNALEVLLRNRCLRVKLAAVTWLGRGVSGDRFRVSGRLFAVVVILITGYWTWTAYEAWRLQEVEVEIKSWPPSRILDNVTIEVTTQCRQSVFFYTVVLLPPASEAAFTQRERTERAKVMTDQLRARLKAIHLELVDKEGYPIAEHEMSVDEFVRLYSSSEERPATLEARGTRSCDAAAYRRAAELKVTGSER